MTRRSPVAVTGLDLAVIGCLPALSVPADPGAGLGAYLAAQAVAGVAVLAGYVWKAKGAESG
jgi:hypothetical protein